MTNESRQALVELLMLALYQDNHLSVLEDAAFEKSLARLGWEPGGSNELCIATAFSKVRGACADELKAEEFLQQRVALLRTGGDALTAYELLSQVLASDGLAGPENRFLGRLGKLLFE